ncbi:MAG: hypothetical protein A2161_06695 [Candidatus Schekmanbacteria bacterium RBG_13_48_7]|uniref:HEPN domain-containing protein n=1 Tax=Candidatus Schekmanbacteria bacterium RBG_13_48_7 TaxID=1817878 RepID=A0A1F7RKX9_9BACT|nr:MAG: hypothetical protein A2161_06695 [Candidatus Schekmanbacteria bacterium RBG_13_48_7]
MTPGEKQIDVIRFWWSKAQDSLNSAKREFEAGAFSFAINRLYYAVFYGVSAALLERGLVFKKHSGVRATFQREFIKSQLLDVKWGKLYDQLFEDRQEGDYIALIEFEKEYNEKQIQNCNQFLENLLPLIKSLQKEQN